MAAQNALKDENSVASALFENASVAGQTRRGQIDQATGRILVNSTSGVVGPASSTDTAIARWNGATGLSIQDSTVLLDGSGNFSGASNVPYITSGTGAPGTTPGKIGDMYIRTSNAKVYVATGTSSSTDWTILN